MRSTSLPKTKTKERSGGGIREVLTSGTIIVYMRLSDMFTLTSRRGKTSSSDEETLAETSGRWYTEEGEKKKMQGDSGAESDGKGMNVTTRAISPPMPEKAERLMGIKGLEVHVRQDVDVESSLSSDERGFVNAATVGRKTR